jgi:2-methylcitrate dehydratase
MLHLNQEQYANAIGISGCHNVTLGAVTAGHLTMMKNTVDPMATQSGVFAALLAQRGYVGPEAIFEGKEGLFAELGVRWDQERLVAGLGSDFKILQCSMKPYPSEALTHSPITATLELVNDHDLQPDDIELVLVQTIARAADILSDPSKYRITSKETADHSLPYCLAAAIADREVTPRQFNPDKLADPRILSLVPKIKARANEEFERLFPSTQSCEVEIRTRTGQVYSCRVDYPKGDPRHPLTDQELMHKFSSLADGVLTRERQQLGVRMINHLESVRDIGELMDVLVADEVHA